MTHRTVLLDIPTHGNNWRVRERVARVYLAVAACDFAAYKPSEIERMARFLGLGRLPPAKLAAIVHAVSFDAMKQSGDMAVVMRKGRIAFRGSVPKASAFFTASETGGATGDDPSAEQPAA